MEKGIENPKQDPFVFGAFMNYNNLKFQIEQLKMLQSYKQVEDFLGDTAQRESGAGMVLSFLGEDPKDHF